MTLAKRRFGISLATSTLLAFTSLVVAYGWANRELVGHLARERVALVALQNVVDYESMTLNLAASVSLAIGAGGFSLTAFLGVRSRPWYVTALVLGPVVIWLFAWALAYMLLSEEYFP